MEINPIKLTDMLSKNKRFICQYCKKGFTRKNNMVVHQKKTCKFSNNATQNSETPDLSNQIKELKENQNNLQKQITQLKDKPLINNQNILQVVCVGQKDNYLDMLAEKWDFDRALEFIKDCALSNLTGDCKLIEKIYLNQGPQLNLYFVDKNRTKIEYYNENKELVRDTKELFGRKLANNIQNSYLKGVNHLINDNLENKRCPNKFLEEYDLQMWNQHIFDLSEIQYQKKLINRLNIPLKTN